MGVNDPNDVGEVRISFGAFLAAGSEELGSLSRTSPDRPRVSQQNLVSGQLSSVIEPLVQWYKHKDPLMSDCRS